MYIDREYYLNEYEGVPMEDEQELNRCIKRASEEMDRLSNFSIVQSKLIDFQQNMLKQATAIMTEHFVMNGGYQATKQLDQTQSVNIGSFSYSSNSSAANEIPNNVVQYLAHAGLLYSGIGAFHGY
ncbi:hypothetical protein M948_20620 [Virgibacillus sp. CM-4]|uniref:Uncharacterized protein n=1 Tax=Virgibacillus massiliensis TaxID=1462526 RepID=A0A024QG95_9BACI|nr:MULTISPECIES: hypothetical protein [Virgibacillus]EQB34789.1 hypothetical protein M948_20620 [Virgibacillus sp. CM-4]CDQ41504.1 hypothetical protein BN990_03877 [Virgibacillus massiliensis]